MTKRDEFIDRIRTGIDELGLKAHLAKLELRDVGSDVQKHYDKFHDRFERMCEATGDQWEALKDGVEASWHAFRDAYRRSKSGES